MSGIVGSKLNIRGSGLVASYGTDGQHMLSAGAGVSNVFETVAAGGNSPFFMATETSDQSIADYTATKANFTSEVPLTKLIVALELASICLIKFQAPPPAASSKP